MQAFQVQRRIIIVVLLAGLLAAVGVLWISTRSDNVAFLPSRPGAKWILYPLPLDTAAHRAVTNITVFRHTFTLDRQPTRAILTVRAFKWAMVAVNGRRPAHLELDGQHWKSVSTADIAALLRAGTNEITVKVANNRSPPALWLRLQTDQMSQGTDDRWQAGLGAGTWQQARLASHPPTVRANELLYQGERTKDSVKRVWLVLVIFCAISTVLIVGLDGWLRRRATQKNIRALSTRFIYVLFAIVVIARIALLVNNLPQLPRFLGFDALSHEAYVQFIQQKHALPLPNDGWQMYQPPLYYLGNALVLDACRLSVPGKDATLVMRSINGVIGLVQCWLALLCLRLLFPANLPAQAVGLLVASFLPPCLYLSQYVTNEPLGGLFATLAFYFCLRVLRAEKAGTGLYLALGVALGAAMLTKFSALLTIPVFLVGLGLRLFLRKEHTPGEWFRSSGVVLLSCLIVSGWHYGRVWVHTGRPIVGNWNAATGFAWSQQPGYQTTAYYFRFGRSLTAPLFSAINGFGDGMYSTLWGDGLVSGQATLQSRPPWNYDLMNAGYLLAIAISFLLLVGFIVTLVQFIRRPRLKWFVVLSLPVVFFLAILYMSLVVPSFFEVKAFYAFPVLAPFSALVAMGWDWLARKHQAIRTGLWIILAVWVMTVYTAFWIRSSNSETWRLRGISQYQEQHYAKATASFRHALRLKPDDATTHCLLAETFASQKRENEAIQQYRDALRIRPDYVDALDNLALLLATGQSVGIRNGAEAVRLAKHACELTHYRKADTMSALAAAYAQAGRFHDAIVTAQQACALAFASGEQSVLELNLKFLPLYRAHKRFPETNGGP